MTMTNKIENEIKSATMEFDHWTNTETQGWTDLQKAVEVQSIKSVENAVKTINFAKMMKEIANAKLIALRNLQK